MMKLRPGLRRGAVVLPLLAVMMMTVSPVAAKGIAHAVQLTSTDKTSIGLPMICPEPSNPNAVQVMVDIDSAYAYKAASWTSPAVGRVVKFQCFDVVGRNKNAEWLLIPYGNAQAWLHGSMVRFRGDLMSLPLTEDVVTKTTLFTALPMPALRIMARACAVSAERQGGA